MTAETARPRAPTEQVGDACYPRCAQHPRRDSSRSVQKTVLSTIHLRALATELGIADSERVDHLVDQRAQLRVGLKAELAIAYGQQRQVRG